MRSFFILKNKKKGSSLAEIGILIGLVAILSVGAISVLGDTINTNFLNATSSLGSPSKQTAGQPTIEKSYKNCNELYDDGQTESGVYAIDVNGSSLPLYCEMITTGPTAGGWTITDWQFENPHATWGNGIDPDRPPSSYLLSSFSLSTSQVPEHQQIAVGRGYSTGAIDFLDAFSATVDNLLYEFKLHNDTYATAKVAGMTSMLSGKATNLRFSNHSEFSVLDSSHSPSLYWFFNTAASPNAAKGAYYNFNNLSASSQSYAWVILVK